MSGMTQAAEPGAEREVERGNCSELCDDNLCGKALESSSAPLFLLLVFSHLEEEGSKHHSIHQFEFSVPPPSL